jgi:curli production assembly/transport component CsgG
MGYTKNSPATLGVREAVQLAVYSLIFEGVKNHLWEFKDRAAGDAFMRELEKQQKAVIVTAAKDVPKS